jgi:hypothetical protein
MTGGGGADPNTLDPRLRGDDVGGGDDVGARDDGTSHAQRAVIFAPGAANSGGYTTCHLPFCTCLMRIRSSP